MLIKIDDVLQGVHRRARAETREVGIEIGLQFVHEDEQFALVELSEGCDVSRIDERSSLLLHHAERLLHESAHGIVKAEILSRYADAGALETARIAVLRVVGLRLAGARRRRRVLGIDARERTQKDRRIAHRAAHRARAVLAMRN